MQITFLGTAASEGYPDVFCGCANCAKALALGGPSLRKRSAALINDDLLIDLGPDLMAAAQMHGVSLAKVTFCLQTHEHDDHLDPTNLIWRSAYSGVTNVPHLHYYASQGAFAEAKRRLGPQMAERTLFDAEVSTALNLTPHLVEPFQTFTVGPYCVTSVAANHDPTLTAMLYVIEQTGRTLFYATDTGEIGEPTWQALHAGQFRFNLVAMDHTFGLAQRVNGHMNWEQFGEQLDRMRKEGLLAADARILAHHLAHHSNPPHPELVVFAAQHGYEVAYDGLRMEV
ncbi:MAG: MBL fold metallo-hydrolase [Caldilineaceae bacterium]